MHGLKTPGADCIGALAVFMARLALAACLVLTLRASFTHAVAPLGDAAVATAEGNATAVGVAVLNEGGNAVDAAIAVAFALAVTLPDAGNIGGGGFMTLYFDGQPGFLDYRETAPAAASRDMYLDKSGEVQSQASVSGHLAAGVPGTVAGLWAAHQRYGSLPWADLVAPAIALAEEGVEPLPWMPEAILEEAKRLGPGANFLSYFGPLRVGEVFRQPELAATLRRIAAKGRAGFYEGETAQLITREMQRGGGLITADDLSAYTALWRTPLVVPWRDYTIVTAPLPSSGGFAVVQYLAMKDLRAADFAGLAHNSPQFVHLKSEIEKRIFADRARYLGDPDFVAVPFQALLDPGRLADRAGQIRVNGISATDDLVSAPEPMHTTHFSILDSWGNAVSNTYTLNTSFGSGVVVSGAGFLLNNEMDDFSLAPGQPNYYGVVGDEANAIAPGKRMLSSMTPTILLRDAPEHSAGTAEKHADQRREARASSATPAQSSQMEVAMVVGAMGGSTIFTTVYQMISNIMDFGMSAKEAQAVGRVHHQLLPKNLITYSPTPGLPEATVDALTQRGYRVEPHFFEFGDVQLIWRDPGGRLSAESDPRFHGVSVVMPARMVAH